MQAEINSFPGYEFMYDPDAKVWRNMYRGIDLQLGGYVYSEPGIHENVALLDCQSQHPSSAILMRAFGEYTDRYEEIYDVRAAIKHYDYETAKTKLNGVLAKYLTDESLAENLANAFKRVLNQTYGVSFADFSPFCDRRNKNNFIALRGSLFMKTLQDEVVNKGYRVCSVRTDSLKIPDATDEIIDFVKEFGLKYGYVLEHEASYDRMCLINKADYIAKYDNMGVRNKKGKHAGEWTSTGAYFSRPYIFKSLFTHEDVVFEDLCQIKEVSRGGQMYLDMNERLDEDEHNYIFVGKVGSFCPVVSGSNGGELVAKRVNKDTKEVKYSAVTGTKGYRWLESDEIKVLGREKDIDMGYFHVLADEAIETISKYGDFEWFARD